MRRVVHIFWGFSYGGIETLLVNLLNEQVRQGLAVHFVVINDLVANDLIKRVSPEVQFHLLKRKRNSKSLWFVVQLHRLLQQLSPETIHLHGFEIAQLLAPKWRKRACATIHALPTDPFVYRRILLPAPVDRLLSRLIGRHNMLTLVPHLVAISESVQKVLLTQYDVRSTLISNGLVTSHFKQREAKAKESMFKMIQVSRLQHTVKGQDLLIDAAEMLVRKRITDFHLTFIGEGESLDYLQQKVEQAQLSSYVSFLGAMPTEYIAENLCNYDLFIQPSRLEAFGLTVAESMAAKVPVLVSSGQGPAEVVGGTHNGWIFKNNDASDLQDQIALIMQQPDLANEKVALAYERVTKQYDIVSVVQQYEKYYAQIEKDTF